MKNLIRKTNLYNKILTKSFSIFIHVLCKSLIRQHAHVTEHVLRLQMHPINI